MTLAEHYTCQFYTWEYRGRGWYVADAPIALEPPFIPFYRHGGTAQALDDGKRHTIVSKLLELAKGKKPPVQEEILDYTELTPFPDEAARDLVALRINMPKERIIVPETVKAFLMMLSGTKYAVSFEIIGTVSDITLQFVCADEDAQTITTYLTAFFPAYTVLQTTDTETILLSDAQTAICDVGLQQEFFRPIATPRHFHIDPLTALYGILEQLKRGEQAGIQVLFQGAVNHWHESIVRCATLPDGSSFFADDPQAPKLAIQKVQSPLFAGTIRAFAQSAGYSSSLDTLQKLIHALCSGTQSAVNQFIPLPHADYDFTARIDDLITRSSHRLGMLLNADELAAIVHFPGENIVSKKLYGTQRKTHPVPPIALHHHYILGTNQHNGINTLVSVSLDDRLKHTHIIGATGTGKSTLLANLILQDIVHGIGVVLFDPHGDLVDTVIARIPQEKLHDVVLIDPADSEFPIGLNILEAHSEIEKEVLASDLVASFQKFATSWGDQMSAILGNTIQALLESNQPVTINDIRRFLLESTYRQTLLAHVHDPSLQYYWSREYPIQKSNSIGPILTRLHTFLRPRSIRNMIIQHKGIDIEALLNSNKIILLKLSQGLIGVENSYLLGALIVSKINQAILRRQQQQKRNPVFLYLDEFQNFITPSVKEMISGIRKYRVGLTLSHQDLQQLQKDDTDLLNAVLTNITTRIVFRVGEPDAKRLEEGFNHFDAGDVQNLGRGEAIIRIEQPQYDCSLDTFPLPHVSNETANANLDRVVAHARSTYARPRSEVEQLLSESLAPEMPIETQKPILPKIPMPPPVNIPAADTMLPKVEKTIPAEVIPPEQPTKDLSTHRYLQTLIKKMAEAYGYTATVEAATPDSSGSVDVLLAKEHTTIAIEISVTTDAVWEMHNIQKCIAGGYSEVISVSADTKRAAAIKAECMQGIPGCGEKNIYFFTPDELLLHLAPAAANDTAVPAQPVMKGYRINVSYEDVSQEQMDRKRKAVAEAVVKSLRRKGK